LGSVADGVTDADDMSDALSITLVLLACIAVGAALLVPLRTRALTGARRAAAVPRPAVGIGTVRSVTDAAEPIVVDVESVSGQRFVGRLRAADGDAAMPDLHPGVVLLVTFDPAARERLSLPDDIVAVRSAFDRMLIRKGLLTHGQLELIRHGIRSRGVVTGVRTTGGAREDYREVELDLMVRRPEGGQFPAHETTLIPASALAGVTPGSMVDTYYRSGDESAVAVCVPPN
jgi:hypothetical protein